MSNDLACLIQLNEQAGTFVHITYAASYGDDRATKNVKTFRYLIEAIQWHNQNCDSEYGLAVDIPDKEPEMTQQTLDLAIPNTVVHTYTRRPFTVQAIKVEDGNMQHIAGWCGGKVSSTREGVPFIELPAGKITRSTHNRAFSGYWVVTGIDGSFSSYSDRAFSRTFERK